MLSLGITDVAGPLFLLDNAIFERHQELIADQSNFGLGRSSYGVSNEGTGRMVVLDSGGGYRDLNYFRWGWRAKPITSDESSEHTVNAI
jgi:hypothetical protein